MVGTHPLKQYRESRGLTQEALGKELGRTAVTIWRWENYKRTPRRDECARIAEVTGLTPGEVAGFAKVAAEQ